MFTTKANLIVHQRTHTGTIENVKRVVFKLAEKNEHFICMIGERPYNCDQCTRTFIEKGTLIRHRRTHTGH